MKKIALILLAATLLVACKKNVNTRNCSKNLVCTENFALVTVRFVDKDGAGVAIKNYSAVNQRTGDTIRSTAAAMMDMVPGAFIVVDDNATKTLSEKGDDIKVSGTHPVTNETKTAIIKVAGGKCACHVEKLSGPDEIQFD